MDLDDLQHFVDVYESRAGISTRIRSLEKVLRQQLFTWRDGSVRATARGEALYTYARGLLDDDLRDGNRGEKLRADVHAPR